MIDRNSYLAAYRKGEEDAENLESPNCDSSEPELVEAYYRGYDDAREAINVIQHWMAGLKQ
jgi:hypothetical protein